MKRPNMKAWLSRVAGNTETVPVYDETSDCTIWLKLEYMLPSGSTKDRVAAFILAHGIESGTIKDNTVVVEASSGSTSIALAMACAMTGVEFVAVMPEGVSPERLLIIQRYGGKIILTPKADGILAAIRRTHEMAEADPNVFLPRQFENPLNALAHQRITGPQLITQVGVRIDGFAAGVGTGGTLMGIARALREMGQNSQIARAHPEKTGPFKGQPEICGGIPGVVDGMSAILDPASVGDIMDIKVCENEAIQAARWLCSRGFPVGPSSGLNFAAAQKLALELGPKHNIATVLCDRMERYFSSDLFSDIQ